MDAPFVTIDGATMVYDERNHIGGLTTFVIETFYENVRARNERKGCEGVPEIVFGACVRDPQNGSPTPTVVYAYAVKR